MPPSVHPFNVTLDPTSVAFVDGLSSTVCGDDLIVYGGPIADRVWRLHLPTATWTEVPCVGTVPTPRFYHAACYCNGFLMVCGGELVVSDTYCRVERLNHYELNLDTYEWSCIDCFGDVPLNRSHHTMTAINGDEIVLFGGKPIPSGVSGVELSKRMLTVNQLLQFRQDGFYDIFVLHSISRTWRKIEMFDVMSPLMWGHSANLYQQSHLLFFGGCDVSLAEYRPVGSSGTNIAAYGGDSAPCASLSNTIHILTLHSFQWQRHQPSETQPAPVPRALHVAECFNDELIVFGGFTIANSNVVNATDSWMWSIKRGIWQRMEFCIPQWSSKKLLSCLYGTQWIVCPALNTVFFIELSRKNYGWQRASCTVQKLLGHPSDVSASLLRPAIAASNGKVVPPHLNIPSPSRISNDPYETPFEFKGTAQRSESGGNDELAALRAEVHALKEQLSFVQSTSHTAHEVLFADTTSSSEKRLHRWVNGVQIDDAPRSQDLASSPLRMQLRRTGVPSMTNGSGSPQQASNNVEVIAATKKSNDDDAVNNRQSSFLNDPSSAVHTPDAVTRRRLKLQLYRRQVQLQKHKHSPQSGGTNEEVAISDASDDDDAQFYASNMEQHQSMMSSSEHKRHLLLGERKRRIQQLQERLRTLEEQSTSASPHRNRSGAANTLGAVYRQADTLRRMIEAQEEGKDWHDEEDGIGSDVASVTAVAPNHHDRSDTLRSASLTSLSESDFSFRPRSIPSTPHVAPVQSTVSHASVQSVKPLAGVENQQQPVVVSGRVRSSSAISNEHQQQSLPKSQQASSILRPKTEDVVLEPLPTSLDTDKRSESTRTPTVREATEEESASTSTHATDVVPPRNVPLDPQAQELVASVFRGFQRPRASTALAAPSTASVVDDTVSTPTEKGGAGSSGSAGRTIRVLSHHTTPPSRASPPPISDSVMQAGEATGSPPPPALPLSGPPSSNSSPPTVSLQSQWDVLQAALMSKSTAPRRVFRSATE